MSSASDLPGPYQLLGGLSCLHLLPLSAAFGPPLTGVMDSFLVPFVFIENARVDVLPFTPHFATRLASRFAPLATLPPPSTRGP